MAKEVIGNGVPRRRRRPTQQGQVLTHEAIIDTALRMLREHGATGLTARRLGLALGADPTTIYRYFRGMDDLTLAIADELWGRALHGWHPTSDWRADLRALGLRIHAAYLSHPQAAVLTASRVSGRPHELAMDETLLGVLLSAGHSEKVAARLYHTFIDQALAFAVLDAASLALPPAARAADQEVWRATYAQLSPDTHPHIAATAPHLVACMNNSAYENALEMFLAAAPEPTRTPRKPDPLFGMMSGAATVPAVT